MTSDSFAIKRSGLILSKNLDKIYIDNKLFDTSYFCPCCFNGLFLKFSWSKAKATVRKQWSRIALKIALPDVFMTTSLI